MTPGGKTSGVFAVVPVSQFFSRLLPYVPACPEPLAQQAVVDAAIEFCESTLIDVVELDPETTVKGVADYNFTLPPQTNLVTVTKVKLDGAFIAQVTADVGRGVSLPSGLPVMCYVSEVDGSISLTLIPPPADSKELSVICAVKPTRNATQLSDKLFNDWADAIVELALYRIMSVPGQPFSNPESAVFYRRKASTAMSNARWESSRGRSRVMFSAVMKPFA